MSLQREVVGLTDNLKFPGQGQRETPVTDVRGIVRIIVQLPCRAAAHIRANASSAYASA